MSASEQRLRGWKAIAAYLNVTESTAIRWSHQGSFPVSKAPNGGSVYADPLELDSWLRSREQLKDATKAEGAVEVPAPLVPPTHGTVRLWALGLAAIAAVCAITVTGARVWTISHPDPGAVAPGQNSEISSMLVEARGNWGSRTPKGIQRAIIDYRQLVAIAPDNAAAFTGLADAYILSCEFAPKDRDAAFREAGRASRTAIALAPRDANANRVAGFLSYWSTRDIIKAEPLFERALSADPHSALTLLWYGNAMIDAGRIRRGLGLLEQAALLAPDSTSTLTDYAIARWQAGDQVEAIASLRGLVARAPNASSAAGALALLSLQSGDLPLYLEQYRHWAALVDDRPQIERAANETAVFEKGGRTALLQAIADAPVLIGPF